MNTRATDNAERAPLLPVTVADGGPICPDCPAAIDGHTGQHADTCPVSRGVDAASDADRDWFADHPAATEYHRRSTWAEREEQRWHVGDLADQLTHVHVIQLKTGLRTRRLYARGVAA